MAVSDSHRLPSGLQFYLHVVADNAGYGSLTAIGGNCDATIGLTIDDLFWLREILNQHLTPVEVLNGDD